MPKILLVEIQIECPNCERLLEKGDTMRIDGINTYCCYCHKNMQISRITITKSKTIGSLTNYGKSAFKKVQISAEAKLAEWGEDPNKTYEELSQFIDDRFEYEKTKK